MMKNISKFLVVSLVAGLSAIYLAPVKAKADVKSASFGACYSLYNCQGGSIGSFDDSQCRGMGGHSINSGGVCINL